MTDQTPNFAEQTNERVEAYFEEVAKVRDDATKQAHEMVDEMAKLAKSQIDYAQRMASEWQRLVSTSSKQYSALFAFPWNRS